MWPVLQVVSDSVDMAYMANGAAWMAVSNTARLSGSCPAPASDTISSSSSARVPATGAAVLLDYRAAGKQSSGHPAMIGRDPTSREHPRQALAGDKPSQR